VRTVSRRRQHGMMEPSKAEPGPPAGGTRPRDPPLLLRSYPTETAAGFPGLLRRHPALDHVPQQADRRTHQGRRGPPPGWLATDVTGRLYTATASTAMQGATDRKQELVRTAPAPAHRAAAAPRRGPRAERPPQAAAAAEQVGTGAPNQLTVPSARRTYADERAGLASERRRVSLGGWPVSESATQQRQQLRRRDSAGHVQQQNFSSSTAARPMPSQQEQPSPRRRRRHTGYFMSPSGYCHTRGSFYKLPDGMELDQDCWTCCGATTKGAPGCVGGDRGNAKHSGSPSSRRSVASHCFELVQAL
jgi:hypothetical protein